MPSSQHRGLDRLFDHPPPIPIHFAQVLIPCTGASLLPASTWMSSLSSWGSSIAGLCHPSCKDAFLTLLWWRQPALGLPPHPWIPFSFLWALITCSRPLLQFLSSSLPYHTDKALTLCFPQLQNLTKVFQNKAEQCSLRNNNLSTQ